MQGFSALRIQFSKEGKACHEVFMRAHSVREKIPEKPPDRTLFLVGVPPYCTEVVLKELFEPFGTVSNVYIHKNPTNQLPPVETSKLFPQHDKIEGFKVAFIVFHKEQALKKVLKNKDILVLPQKSVVTGINKWLAEQKERLPNPKELEDEIEKFMKDYDDNVVKKNKDEKSLGEADEDGWVTVTKKGRRPGFTRKESVKKQLTKRSERQNQKKELSNFYRFQIRESKMKNLVALRQKFEEDKKKIATLKQTRRFKPF